MASILNSKYLIVLLLIIIIIGFFSIFKHSTYEQGIWNVISYKGVNGTSDTTTSQIKVTRSEFIMLEDRIRLFVYFKVNNTEDYPNSFGWINKFIETEDGLAFSPSKGMGVNNLQPYVKSNELYIEYKLPTYVDIQNIYWGLYDNPSHSLRYKISLHPIEKMIVRSFDSIRITPDKLIADSNNLIGLKVQMRCKGSEFMQFATQNINTFNTVCQNRNKSFPLYINYNISFKFANDLLPTINKIKNQLLEFDVIGTVEWAEPISSTSQIIIDVESIDVEE